MKKRKPSDPLSWFYQAAIHGVTTEAVIEAAKTDPGVERVFQKRYWNQCPHNGENSANFLPWHRGYTYWFEKILRMHSEIDDFALPYWNYTEPKKLENRFFPKEFGIQHLDGNLSNDNPDNINPLFDIERDYYFCGYEHPFAQGLPLLALSESAVDTHRMMNCDVFFGDVESEGIGGGIADEDPSTRGLVEQSPHDQIHRAVGGIITKIVDGKEKDTVGAMANPSTAGFDPIFPVHHSNIDRLWAEWSCMPGKAWGKLPSEYWFNERAWFFYDTDGRVANEPRKAYFDYRGLGIRFKYEDETCTPLALPDVSKEKIERLAHRVHRLELLTTQHVDISVLPLGRSALRLKTDTAEKLRTSAMNIRTAAPANRNKQRIIARISNVDLGLVWGTGFDVHLTDQPAATLSRRDASFVGSISLFRHTSDSPHDGHMHGASGESETFDVTKAIASTKEENINRLHLVLIPYPLLTVPGRNTTILNRSTALKASGLEILTMDLQ